MVVDGKEYPLLQFHFHWPSEHTVGGRQFLMELHLVHKSADGTLAVLGIFLDRGNHNSRLDPIWYSMPTAANAVLTPPGLFDVTTLFPADKRTYRYPGSLTTPPCSEGVRWHLFKAPVEMSASQAQAFNGIVGFNSRYVQPLNGREVLEDSSIGQ
jgi:carbonic anhydrase